VLLGNEGEELYREKPEAKRETVAEAFKRHGYSWRDRDPFADHYVRWVADTPGLTPSMNALFLAREKAIENDDQEDAADLRRELSKLGITVRDDGKRQYWRQHGQKP
jgi:cysteinyl-tRNA synthetase